MWMFKNLIKNAEKSINLSRGLWLLFFVRLTIPDALVDKCDHISSTNRLLTKKDLIVKYYASFHVVFLEIHQSSL